ncbi:hypothetical protein Tco_0621346, partial [Tanacetum coccineum]
MILCLGNKVLREVTEETTAVGVWSKLKSLYMTKSLTYQEAVSCEDNSKLKAAMKEEMDSLRKNMTWELV